MSTASFPKNHIRRAKNFVSLRLICNVQSFVCNESVDKYKYQIHAESWGAWHPVAVAEVVKLGKALARHTCEEEQTTIQHLFQRLSVALMKGNAALFNNRVPDSGAAGEDL